MAISAYEGVLDDGPSPHGFDLVLRKPLDTAALVAALRARERTGAAPQA